MHCIWCETGVMGGDSVCVCMLIATVRETFDHKLRSLIGFLKH